MNRQLFRSAQGVILLVVIISIIFICPIAMAQTDEGGGQSEIVVIGTGIISGGNVAKAKETAISEALILGVENYLSSRLGRQGMINNFPRLVQDIIPFAKDEVENFNILAEEQTSNHYKILVRVKINERVMDQKLRETGLVLMTGPSIKTLFLVSQVEPDKGENAYWWHNPESASGLTPTELALHRVFQERGLRPINRLLTIPEENYTPDMTDLDLSDEKAVQWGELYGADVAINGRCEILGGFGVILRLSAVDVKRGLLISQATEIERTEASPQNKEQIMGSVEKAINKIAVKMIPPIVKAMEPQEERPQQMEITLKGLKNFQQFRAYRDFLKKEIPGVKSVRQTRIRGDAMSILVEFTGDRDEFLDKLSKPENLPFEVEMELTDTGEIVVKIQEIS
jgi:hypothetical protein